MPIFKLGTFASCAPNFKIVENLGETHYTKACTGDSIVESAVLSMKMISHTTQGMQVSYNATTPSPNNQSFILATCSRKHKVMGMKLTHVHVHIHVQNKHYIYYVLIFKDIPTI